MPTKWSFEADFFQTCNCEYGCPCEFEGPPSHGFCEGMGQWQIVKGKYGDVNLDGLGIGFAARWPAEIHKGNGTAALFVDAKANPQQRDALAKIVTGEAGGLPFEILKMTISKLLPIQYVPFEYHADGKRWRGKMGDAVIAGVEPIRNPVNGQEESIRVEHATGFIFKVADAVSAREMTVKCGELNFSHPNKAGFVARVNYGN